MILSFDYMMAYLIEIFTELISYFENKNKLNYKKKNILVINQ